MNINIKNCPICHENLVLFYRRAGNRQTCYSCPIRTEDKMYSHYSVNYMDGLLELSVVLPPFYICSSSTNNYDIYLYKDYVQFGDPSFPMNPAINNRILSLKEIDLSSPKLVNKIKNLLPFL